MRKDLITERLKLTDIYPERAKEVAKEYGLKAEEIELVRKGVVSEKVEADKEEKSVISYINTASKDRDNEVIDPQGAILTNYRKNPVVPWGHDYRGLPVGKNIWVKKDKNGLIAKTVFLKHPFATDVAHCYTEDVVGTGPAMKAWSIGFIPLKWEENPDGKEASGKEGEKDSRVRRRYKKWELVEYSAVMVPSNPDALTVMVEKGLITSDKLKKDIEEFIEIEPIFGDTGPNDWLEEVCPECGEPVTDEVVAGGFYNACTKCEWTNADGKTDPDLVLKRVITKPEETDDYIRLPAKGEEGKHKKHKIRWITVSAKEGIKGIYCIDCKKIISFVFDKKKGWTMAKAKKWMEDHGKQITDTIFTVNKWNDKQESNIDLDEILQGIFDGDGEVIELVEKDDKLNQKLDQAIKQADEGKVTDVNEIIDKTEKELETKGLETKEPTTEQLTQAIGALVDEVKFLKEGRVLSEKNRKLIQDCLSRMEAVIPPLRSLLTATEPPKREEIEIDIEKDNQKDNRNDNADKMEINTDKLTGIIQEALKNNVDKIAEMVRTKLDKMRGKVE